MAGEEHLIALSGDEPPWPLLLEIAGATPDHSWVLVGGLMVHVHALRAGVLASRPTRDVDLALDLEAVNVSAVAGPLQALGFRPEPGSPLHRFARDGDIVDVMVATGQRARWSLRNVFQAPAVHQAVSRRDWYVLQTPSGGVRIGVPDALGAIVVKAAAYTADQRDRGRHLEDLAVLLASAGGPRTLQLERLLPRDRQHLRHAVNALLDPISAAWSVLDDFDRQIGQRTLTAIANALG